MKGITFRYVCLFISVYFVLQIKIPLNLKYKISELVYNYYGHNKSYFNWFFTCIKQNESMYSSSLGIKITISKS